MNWSNKVFKCFEPSLPCGSARAAAASAATAVPIIMVRRSMETPSDFLCSLTLQPDTAECPMCRPLRPSEGTERRGVACRRRASRRSGRGRSWAREVRTTLAIYTHAMRRKHADSADRMAQLAGLTTLGNNRETISSVEPQEEDLSDCFSGSPGWNRTNDQRINSPMLYR
jgi:hypothetical protein